MEFKRLRRYVFLYKKLFFAAVFVILINAVATLAPAEWGQHAVRLIENKEFETFPLMALLALGIILLKVLTDFLRKYLMNWLGQLISARMQKEIHQKILSLPLSFFRKNEIGQVISKTTNDITIIRYFFSQNLPSFLKDPLTIIFGMIMLFTKNLVFTLELLGVGILIALVMQVVGNRIRRLSKQVQDKIGKTVSRLHESLSAIDVIKVFNRKQHHERLFESSVNDYLKTSKKEIVLDALGTPINEFLSFLAAFIVIGTGIVLINNGSMEASELVSFVLYIAILSQPLNALTNLVLQYKKASASALRVFEILDEESEDDLASYPALDRVSGEIRFDRVSFSYEEQNQHALKNVSFSIKAGETIALVGPSGSGKTSLINLLARLFIPKSGKIYLDGQDIAQVSLASLRDQIGYVPQESILFPISIGENIRYGKLSANDDEVIRVAKLTHADRFIRKLPQAYQSTIGERGSKLSGGQRQRLTLARALIKEPPILILDEATSALDTVSEAQIHRTLKKILGQQTTIIIAHKLQTVMLADRIFVLDQGRVVETGSHADLISKSDSLYHKLWKSQTLQED